MKPKKNIGKPKRMAQKKAQQKKNLLKQKQWKISTETDLDKTTEPKSNLTSDKKLSSNYIHDQGPQITTRVGRKIRPPTRFANQVENLVENPEMETTTQWAQRD